MTAKKAAEEPDFLARIPLTFRDYEGDVEDVPAPVVTSVLLPAPDVSVTNEAAKPAKKEN